MKENLNLENIKVGDKLTIIKVTPNGLSYKGVYVVSSYSENHKGWRYRRIGSNVDAGIFGEDGVGYYAMKERNGDPDFYYSFNPIHIKKTEENIELVRIEKESRDKRELKNLHEFKDKLESLMEYYGVELYPTQTMGDTHGVEMIVNMSSGDNEIEL